MDTRFLQTLLAVVETGSFTRAAHMLNLTPSAVMQRIKVLEAEIGTQLVLRSGGSMCASPACCAIIDDARRLVNGANDIKAVARGRLDVGSLRVGVVHTVLTGLMPDTMLALQRDRPGIDLYILPGTSIDLYGKLLAGELDLAIVVEPGFALPKAFEWTLLREEMLLLITPRTLIERNPYTILKREPFIRYDRNHWGGRMVDAFLRQQGIAPRERYELDSLEAIAILVDRGLGVALIPDWPPPWPDGIDVQRLPLSEAPSRRLGIIAPKASRRQHLIHAFLSEMVGVAARKPST